MTNLTFYKQEKTAYKISGMPVQAMAFVILGVGALKQWFIEDLSDTIRLQTIGSITTSLKHPQIQAIFPGYLTGMQRGLLPAWPSSCLLQLFLTLSFPMHQGRKRSYGDPIVPFPMELSTLLQALGFIIKTVWDTDCCQICLQCWQAVKVTKRELCAKICTLACQAYNPDAYFLIGKGFNKYETISFSLCLESSFPRA